MRAIKRLLLVGWFFSLLMISRLPLASANPALNLDTDLFRVTISGRVGYIDKTGTVRIQPQFQAGNDFSEGLAAVKPDNNGKWGFIDHGGELVIAPVLDEVNGFDNEVAAVAKANLWGLINTKGEFLIQPRYEYIAYFENGLAQTFFNGKEGYIDATGKVVWEPSD